MGGNQSHTHDVAHFHSTFTLVRCSNTDSSPVMCGICCRKVDLGKHAYRCEQCPEFHLHDTCFHYPRSSKLADHSLVLTRKGDVTNLTRCSMCDETFDGVTCVYVCSSSSSVNTGCTGGGEEHDCGGGGLFRAHPRCVNLPRSINAAQHRHKLVLRPRRLDTDQLRRRRNNCLDSTSHHHHHGAWAYECPDAECGGVEICLASEMAGGCTPRPAASSCCGGGGLGVVEGVGQAVGVFLRGMVEGYTGLTFTSCFARFAAAK